MIDIEGDEIRASRELDIIPKLFLRMKREIVGPIKSATQGLCIEGWMDFKGDWESSENGGFNKTFA